jgi:hypothetical protein
MPGSEPGRPIRIPRRTYLAALGTGALSGSAGCSASREGIASEELGPSGGAADGTWSRHVRLAPNDEGVGHFGSSVALGDDDTTALVSATHHRGSDGSEPGPAYVLGRTDDGWRQQARLVPDDGGLDTSFGWKGESTALSGDATTALVGADKADEPNGPNSGVAYVFERADGRWSRQVKLVPDGGAKQDFFGTSVALSGDGAVALVGAWGAGSAYAFERTDDRWSQRASLAPEDGEGGGAFGESVALSGDVTTAVVGAPYEDTPDGDSAGSAYVFERTGGSWRQGEALAAEDGDARDFFGGAIALAGDTAVIGAPEDDDPNGADSGSAYVFERTGGSWSQQAKLASNDGDSTDLFGVVVALSGDGTTALVGARVDEDPNGDSAGSAYVFERTGGSWSQRAKLAPGDGESNDVFGRSVALAGDTAFVGTASGKAYVF